VRGRRGECFASRVWTFVVDPGARHGIACHCRYRDSSVFSSSLALEMDLDDSFIFS